MTGKVSMSFEYKKKHLTSCSTTNRLFVVKLRQTNLLQAERMCKDEIANEQPQEQKEQRKSVRQKTYFVSQKNMEETILGSAIDMLMLRISPNAKYYSSLALPCNCQMRNDLIGLLTAEPNEGIQLAASSREEYRLTYSSKCSDLSLPRPPHHNGDWERDENNKGHKVTSPFTLKCRLFINFILIATSLKCVTGKDLILREKSSADEEMLAFLIGFVLFLSILIIGSIITKCLWSRPFKYNRSHGKLFQRNLSSNYDCDDVTNGFSITYGSIENPRVNSKCNSDSTPKFTNTLASASFKSPCKVTTSFVHSSLNDSSIKGRINNSRHHFVSNITSFCVNLIPWDLVEDDSDDEDADDDTAIDAEVEDEEYDENQHDSHHQSNCGHQHNYNRLNGQTIKHEVSSQLPLVSPHQVITHSSHIHQNILNCSCASCKDIKLHKESLTRPGGKMFNNNSNKNNTTVKYNNNNIHNNHISCDGEGTLRSKCYQLTDQLSGNLNNKPIESIQSNELLSWSSEPGVKVTSWTNETRQQRIKQQHQQQQQLKLTLKIPKPCQFQKVSYL